MEAKASVYIPYAFQSFQGFSVVDIKESGVSKEMNIVLEKVENKGSSLRMLRRSAWGASGSLLG